MRVLVTGVAGYIGSNLAFRAKECGFDVLGIDGFTDYYNPAIKRNTAKRLVAAGVEVLEGDLTAATSVMPPYLEGVDAVVHLAGQPGISEATPWEDYQRNNVLATNRLLEAVKRMGTSLKFVNISSSSVYGLHAMDRESAAPKPASWYGVTKLSAEQEVMAAQWSTDFSACSLRLFSVYGERERPEKLFPKLIRAIDLNLEFPLFEGSLEHQRSFTYVGDVCEGILATLGNWDRADGEIFNLGTDQCFTTGEAIRTVEEIMGKQANLKIVPQRLGDQKATHANIDKIGSALGWAPKTSLKAGLTKMVDWYMSEVKGKIDWV
ncbi:MAG: NAD-dependent epimerase/dehydratase family protein [Opitutaceae bacterium]|nr:NAD-dependent epimerase/dehydratase family protein [Opitutaceae bacterium]